MGFLPEHDPRPIPVTVLGDTGNYLHRSVGLHIVLFPSSRGALAPDSSPSPRARTNRLSY